jgi:hypothetical protein
VLEDVCGRVEREVDVKDVVCEMVKMAVRWQCHHPLGCTMVHPGESRGEIFPP